MTTPARASVGRSRAFASAGPSMGPAGPSDRAGFLVDVQHASPDQIEKARHQLGVDRPA